MSSRLRDLVAVARETLAEAGIAEAAREAQLLAAAAAGVPADRVPISMNESVGAEANDRLQSMLGKRVERRPLSHILGTRHFFNHRFHISPQVLDPRPETEILIEAALAGEFFRVLDLGTGSGAILISLLAARHGAEGVGTDLSEDALAVARGNAEEIGVAAACSFLQSDWFSAVDGRFDLIVSNPPYIAADEMAGLAPELAYEPRMALTDEADGLSAYRAITAGAPDRLSPGGRLIVEIGPTQAAAVAGMFRAAGLEDVVVLPDLDGRDRVVSGRMPAR